jgi:hypothetical protein
LERIKGGNSRGVSWVLDFGRKLSEVDALCAKRFKALEGSLGQCLENAPQGLLGARRPIPACCLGFLRIDIALKLGVRSEQADVHDLAGENKWRKKLCPAAHEGESGGSQEE